MAESNENPANCFDLVSLSNEEKEDSLSTLTNAPEDSKPMRMLPVP
jgi:hypothetical protein